MIHKGLKRQHATGYFQGAAATTRVSGRSAGVSAALLRSRGDGRHAARCRASAAPGLGWLESRVSPRGVITIAGNTRTGAAQGVTAPVPCAASASVAVSRVRPRPPCAGRQQVSRRWHAPWQQRGNPAEL